MSKPRVRTAKGRPVASTKWLARQLADPYIARARAEGYRSRAAYKLLEMDAKAHFLRPGALVLDLGAAPGGWSQVAAAKGCRVVATDILPMDPLSGVAFTQMDFMDDAAPARLVAALGGPAALVMSDMAPNTTGHRATDHLRIVAMAEAALDLAQAVLAPGGAFLAKLWQGGAQGDLHRALTRGFAKVRTLKPPASRKDSAECYALATGFRGRT
ncbi:MAG TPA: rRNA methyltransferase [Rhodospirillaceae bacterium]|jgi:23S rRNA (uridine2552-2'-O)-methyltransferase|nr:RlmE family RNA methyltransferase [Alphaproteobacteria bacterium]HBH26719.1 rRNA methyltransferase [Rhodospirillaceae bacterium]